MDINKCTKFQQFVGENKGSFLRRMRFELYIRKNLKEKKDFLLSEEDIDTIYVASERKNNTDYEDKKDRLGTLFPKIIGTFQSSLSDEDFEDIFQESIVVLYEKIGTKIECTLSTFFYSICYRQALKRLRDKNKIELFDSTDLFIDNQQRSGVSPQKINQIIQTIPSRVTAPDNAFDISQMKDLVHNALNEMAGKCRQLLTKYYIEGFSWIELASDYELKDATTAKAMAYRCRKRFEEKHRELIRYVKNK